MKYTYIISLTFAFFAISNSQVTIAGGLVYQCISSTGEITLQDKACNPNTKENIIKLTSFPKESNDSLRPLELTLLERNHELEKMRKEHQYILKEQNSLAQTRFEAKKRMYDHKLKSFLFYKSRMDYPFSNGYPFGKVGHNHGGAIAGFGAPGTFGGTTTTNSPITASDGSTSLGVVNSGSGNLGAGIGGAGGGPSGTGGPGFIININP